MAAGEEITFCYVPLKQVAPEISSLSHAQEPMAWPLERRQDFLAKTFGFRCSCPGCLGADSLRGRPTVLMRWLDAPLRLLVWLELPSGSCDVSPTELRLCEGSEEQYVRLPCAMEVLEARRHKGLLRLTLKALEAKGVWSWA